jgi:hypothetical protein
VIDSGLKPSACLLGSILGLSESCAGLAIIALSLVVAALAIKESRAAWMSRCHPERVTASRPCMARSQGYPDEAPWPLATLRDAQVHFKGGRAARDRTVQAG